MKSRVRSDAKKSNNRLLNAQDTYSVLDPRNALTLETNDGMGFGPLSYSSIPEKDKREHDIKSRLVEEGVAYFGDKDVKFMDMVNMVGNEKARDKFVIDKVFQHDMPYWKGAEDILQKRLDVIKDTARKQLMDAKIFYQGGIGSNAEEYDRAYQNSQDPTKDSRDEAIHLQEDINT